MKKLTTALLTALLLLNLAACGEKEPDDTPSGYDDSLISELYSEEGEYTDAENNTLAYSYHVPRIMSETAVAAALNDEIADQFGALVQEQKNMMASRVSLTCLSVTWTSYWNDSLLCLVVRAEMDGDTSMTETYSYDFFGGKRLMSEDLLARCELSTQDFITAARRTAANYFDETYRDALSGSVGGAGFIASYAERRTWTLSDENINAEMRLYLDSGALHMIVPVGSFAGAESYDAACTTGSSHDGTISFFKISSHTPIEYLLLSICYLHQVVLANHRTEFTSRIDIILTGFSFKPDIKVRYRVIAFTTVH